MKTIKKGFLTALIVLMLGGLLAVPSLGFAYSGYSKLRCYIKERCPEFAIYHYRKHGLNKYGAVTELSAFRTHDVYGLELSRNVRTFKTVCFKYRHCEFR